MLAERLHSTRLDRDGGMKIANRRSTAVFNNDRRWDDSSIAEVVIEYLTRMKPSRGCGMEEAIVVVDANPDESRELCTVLERQHYRAAAAGFTGTAAGTP